MHQDGEPLHPSQDNRYDAAIRVVEYEPSWEEKFEREAAAIRRALGSAAVRVDHVGSTSVPGLSAKPIIDINISVPDITAVDSYRRPLEGIGYLFVPVPESPDFHFFGKPATRPRIYHIHVSRVPGSGVRGTGSGERETTASSLAGKEESSRKEDNGGQGKDGPAGVVAQGGNGR